MTQLELPLSVAEKDLFVGCEVVIERSLGVFIEVGDALVSIRDNRLYRADYLSFEDYCRDRWQIDASYANRMISAARVVELISAPIGAEINSDEVTFPATESQARELTPLLDDPDELREVWNEAIDRTDGKPTAAAIRQVREEREERTEPTPWTDDELRLRAEVGSGLTAVANLRGGHRNLIAWAEENDLYVRIDRRTDWGNPFELPADGDRQTVIASYRDHYLPHKPSLGNRVGELRGKVLGCWCAPEACHGDVLKARAEE